MPILFFLLLFYFNISPFEIYIPENNLQEETAVAPEEEVLAVFSCKMPEGVKIIGIYINESNLILNISGDINLYGGNAFEQELVARLLDAASKIPGIETLTILTEGQLIPLPEGRLIHCAPVK